MTVYFKICLNSYLFKRQNFVTLACVFCFIFYLVFTVTITSAQRQNKYLFFLDSLVERYQYSVLLFHRNNTSSHR